MKRLALLSCLAGLFAAHVALAAGATKASAASAISGATVAMKKADAIHSQWTPTVTDMKAAQAAFDKGDYVTAQKMADMASKLAVLSVDQANSQKHLWRNEVIH
ncbi:MAG TPA: hypothetical protein PLC74_14310 [Acetobacteraceae bacterium]|nr:hypothetical protein [Acetobacteraceae bacterium]